MFIKRVERICFPVNKVESVHLPGNKTVELLASNKVDLSASKTKTFVSSR